MTITIKTIQKYISHLWFPIMIYFLMIAIVIITIFNKPTENKIKNGGYAIIGCTIILFGVSILQLRNFNKKLNQVACSVEFSSIVNQKRLHELENNPYVKEYTKLKPKQ